MSAVVAPISLLDRARELRQASWRGVVGGGGGVPFEELTASGLKDWVFRARADEVGQRAYERVCRDLGEARPSWFDLSFEDRRDWASRAVQDLL